MLQQPLSLSFLKLSFIFSLLSVSKANSNVYFQCSQLNFTSITPYESNVNLLLTSLGDSASIYNFNKFETSPQSDSVYGLFQCRGDLSSPNCKDCVASAISQIKTLCHMSIGGEIQLEGCFVKYDDTSFFGVEDKMEMCRRCGPSIGYNSDVLNRIDVALAYLVGGNREYFRGGDFGNIQGVAQCVQDLSLSDCQDCLQEASGRLRSECETSTWGDMYLRKCYIRYADHGSGNHLNNGNGNDPSHKRNKRSRRFNLKVVLNWVFIFLSYLWSTAGTCFSSNKANKAKKVAKSAKSEAASAKKKAQEVEDKADEALVKVQKAIENNEKINKPITFGPYGPRMPPCY